MSITGRILSLAMKLPPAETPDIVVTRDLKVPMPDGVNLLTDHYAPKDGKKYPTLLVRSPYGRSGFFGTMFVLPYAERGYHVVAQSCRGTAGSEGKFIYGRHEHDDGLATIEWIKKQDWFSGDLALIGPSYLGFVQWAVAASAGPELKAMVPSITTSDFNHFRFQGGSINMESMLGWSTMMTEQAETGMKLGSLLNTAKREALLDKAFNFLPLKEADRVVVGKPSQSWQDSLEHGPEDEYWKPVDYSHTVKDLDVPVDLIGGWYDLFLYWQLKDYQRLREAGKQPYLMIGPWFHGEMKSMGPTITETVDWLDAHLKGKKSELRPEPVRIFVMGAEQWRNFADWPPPAKEQRWYLQPNGALTQDLPPVSEPDQYRYNPADPTPAVGGNSLGKYMGVKDNRELEARPDVLVYTSEVLKQDLEVIGPVKAELYVCSSLENTDFFARLCVVKKSGKSMNLCDGLVRLAPGSNTPEPQRDGSLCLEIELWPTAYHFSKGERIRVQVSSGAHPRFARNTGSGEPVGEETTLRLANQTIYHDPTHPSSFSLPVVSN